MGSGWTGLLHVLLDDYGGVVAAEAEGVGEGSAHGAVLCLAEGEVEVVVDFGIVVAFFVVDCGGHDIFLDGFDAEHCFEGAGGTEQVSGHGFGGRDVELVSFVAEYFEDGFDFGDVAHGG